jgi:copper chaperone CopZ
VSSVSPDPVKRQVTVTLDEGKGSIDNVVEAMKKAGYVVDGAPKRLPPASP